MTSEEWYEIWFTPQSGQYLPWCIDSGNPYERIVKIYEKLHREGYQKYGTIQIYQYQQTKTLIKPELDAKS
jgi:hypothetical protein